MSDTLVETSDELTSCSACGAEVAGAKFCSECGARLSADDAPADAPTEVMGVATDDHDADSSSAHAEHGEHEGRGAHEESSTHAPTPSAATVVNDAPAPAATGATPSRINRGVIAGVAGILVVGAIAVVAFLALRDDPEAAAVTEYRKDVAATFGPVLGANEELSSELSTLAGSDVKGAQAAVERARDETARAQGAFGALDAPESESQLERDGRQVLDQEEKYLQAVNAVLAAPASTTVSQIVTLESNLTGALSAAGPTVAGRSRTVYGADDLARWAPSVAAAKRRARAQADRERRQRAARETAAAAATATPAPAATAPAAPVPFAGSGTNCGGGLWAGPNTSCSFAAIVRDAYWQAPGASATVRAYSPVTNETYTMNCAPAGSGITCSGGNNASVSF